MKYRNPNARFTGVREVGALIKSLICLAALLAVFCTPIYFGARFLFFGAETMVAVAESGDELKEIGESLERGAEYLEKNKRR